MSQKQKLGTRVFYNNGDWFYEVVIYGHLEQVLEVVLHKTAPTQELANKRAKDRLKRELKKRSKEDGNNETRIQND